VSDQRDTHPSEYLARVNADLARSVQRCRLLVEDCRAHLLPANSNEPPTAGAAADSSGYARFMLVQPGDAEQPDG
jgi:hypothetical protein